MLTLNKIIFVILVTVIAMISPIGLVGAVQDETDKMLDLPTLDTSIAAKMQYKKFFDPVIVTPPVPESEMSHIRFSEAWIMENDLNPHTKTIKIAFPSSWVNDIERQFNNNLTIDLSIPTQMLIDANESRDFANILVSFPSSFFKGLPTLTANSFDSNYLSDMGAVEGVRSTLYQRRIWYDHIGDDILGVEGIVYPTDNTNENNSILAYQEIECYGAGNGDDATEIITEIQDDGDIYVWYAIWDDGSWVTSRNWLIIEVDVEDEIDYYFYLSGSTLRAYLYDTSWHSATKTVTPPDDYTYFAGSSELYVDSVSDDFYLRTSPISIEYVYAGGYWEDQYYVNDYLGYWYKSSSTSYVDVYSYINEYDGLRFTLLATD